MTKRRNDPAATGRASADDLLDSARLSIEEGVSGVRAALAGIREELGRRRAALSAALSVPPTRAEALARVEAAAASLAPRVRMAEPLRYERASDSVDHLRDVPAAELIAVLAPELLISWMMRPLDAAAAAKGGWSDVPPEVRRAERERLELDVAEMESAEAKAVAVARRSGLDLDDFPPLPEPPRRAGTYDANGMPV